MKIGLTGIILSAAVVSAGCSLSSAPDETFDLVTPAAVDQTVSEARGVQLLVAEPKTIEILASKQVVVRVGERAVQYLGGVRLADALPRFAQFKIKRALEGSRAVGAVGLPGDGLAIDYQIITDIRAFEIRTDGPETAFVSLTVKVLDDRTGTVIASRVFDAAAPVAGTATVENEAYIAALDTALDNALVQVTNWVGQRV